MNDFKQLMMDEFNVPEDKAAVLSDRVSDYINQRVDMTVRKVQQDTLSSLTDPNRGDYELHQAIMNRDVPDERTVLHQKPVKSFAQFRANQ
jgi:hypothetical protein